MTPTILLIVIVAAITVAAVAAACGLFRGKNSNQTAGPPLEDKQTVAQPTLPVAHEADMHGEDDGVGGASEDEEDERPRSAKDLIAIPERATIPERLPVIYTRNTFLLPGSTTWLDVGRAKSLRVLDEVKRDPTMLVAIFAQKDPRTENPAQADLHPIGCAARVNRIVVEGGQVMGVVVSGVHRVRLLEVEQSDPYMVAGIESVAPIWHASPESLAAYKAVKEKGLRLIRKVQGISLPEDTADTLAAIDDPGMFADVFASFLRGELMTDLTDQDALGLQSAPDVLQSLRLLEAVIDRHLAIYEKDRRH